MASSPASPLPIPRVRSSSNMSIPSPRSQPSTCIPPPAVARTASCESPPSSDVRRTHSGQFMASPSPEENDPGGEFSSEFAGFQNYTVQIPPTPDHQPMSATPSVPFNPKIAVKAEQQFVSNTLFSGGFNSVTRGHVMDKMIESESSDHPQMACARGISGCAIKGCDGKVVRDERGEDLAPCECGFKICSDCYFDAVNGQGLCPGCKEGYRALDQDSVEAGFPIPATAESKMKRRLSLLKSFPTNPPLLMSKQVTEFDHTRWLYESKGTYGYGNAVWPKELSKGGEKGSTPPSFNERSRRPLSRKTSVSAAIINPYRLLVFIRMMALGLFLAWRVRHPNTDAMWLWGMSVICEIWFGFTWILDQLPKLIPVNRSTDLKVLKETYERACPENPGGRSDLPGIDVFVSTADPEKEPPLVTANTILSILAVDYPVEKVTCYLSDDGGSLLNFEALAEAASFSRIWVPFCRKHGIEPRNPERYFQSKGDHTKNKVRTDFVKERRRMKREYDEFKVRINGLPDSIRRRSDAYNAHEEIRAKREQMEQGAAAHEALKVKKATWMADGAHWPGTWALPATDHGRGDHAGIMQIMLPPASSDPILGEAEEDSLIDAMGVDVRLPMLVYVSREKRPGYDHNKKAGAMNSLVRSSSILSNGAFILNLDCDHYIYNSLAMREAMCFMMDKGGDTIAYVQFPQRFEGIDTNDRYANRNTVFFDVNMRALDGLQGPMYVGTGCVFRRVALYGFSPPQAEQQTKPPAAVGLVDEEEEEREAEVLLPKRFGSSISLMASIPAAEFEARPLAEQAGARRGRPAWALTVDRPPLDAATVAEAINVISCYYEDKTEWGISVGWIYGSVTEDVVTGYRMHNKGWSSVYCVTKPDAFRGTAPINLTDRLHQVLRWATGSVEIFFSRNYAIFGSTRLKFLQRLAYVNVGIYPFTSIFLTVYCFLPALSLFTGHFIVQRLSVAFLAYLLTITATMCALAALEVRWSGITLEEWWRNEQFWLIGGTSAHMAAVLQGLLKVAAGIDISFTLTAKGGGGGGEEDDVAFAELYAVRWTALMIPPITIMMTNVIAVAVGVTRALYSTTPQWSKLLGGAFFSLWVLAHLYPFVKGLMGRRGRTPTIVFVWSGLLAIIISLLWVSISPPSGSPISQAAFQFP